MVKFGVIFGKWESDFGAFLESGLQNLQENVDYRIFQESYGNVRRKQYIILSEKAVSVLQKNNWEKMQGFEKIEVGNIIGPGEDTDELMKFVVENFVNEYVTDYQTNNPTTVSNDIYRSRIEMIDRQRELMEKSHDRQVKYIEELDAQHAFSECSFSGEPSYNYFEKYKDGKWEIKEKGSPQASEDKSISNFGDSKYCSNCNRDFPLSANFCSGCREVLVTKEVPHIQEITDQEAQEIQHQQRPFFPKRQGG